MWANAHRVWHPGHGNVRAWLGLDGGQGESAHATVQKKKRKRRGASPEFCDCTLGLAQAAGEHGRPLSRLPFAKGAGQRNDGGAHAARPRPRQTRGVHAHPPARPLSFPDFHPWRLQASHGVAVAVIATGEGRVRAPRRLLGVREKEERARALERAVPSATERRGVLLLLVPRIQYYFIPCARRPAPRSPLSAMNGSGWRAGVWTRRHDNRAHPLETRRCGEGGGRGKGPGWSPCPWRGGRASHNSGTRHWIAALQNPGGRGGGRHRRGLYLVSRSQPARGVGQQQPPQCPAGWGGRGRRRRFSGMLPARNGFLAVAKQ